MAWRLVAVWSWHLACTFRVAVPKAKLGLPEIKLGRALAIGLVNRVIGEGDLMDGAKQYARQFTYYGLPSLRLVRDSILRATDLPLAEGLKAEAELSAISFSTEDAKEGTGTFLQKRPPQFKDR